MASVLSKNKEVINKSGKVLTLNYIGSDDTGKTTTLDAGANATLCVKDGTDIEFSFGDGTTVQSKDYKITPGDVCNKVLKVIVEGDSCNIQLNQNASYSLPVGTHYIDTNSAWIIQFTAKAGNKFVTGTNLSISAESYSYASTSIASEVVVVKSELVSTGGGGDVLSSGCPTSISWVNSGNVDAGNGQRKFTVEVTSTNGKIIQYNVDNNGWYDGGTDNKFSFVASAGRHTVSARVKDCSTPELTDGVVDGTVINPPPPAEPKPGISFSGNKSFSYNNIGGQLPTFSFSTSNANKIRVTGDYTGDFTNTNSITIPASALNSVGVKKFQFMAMRDNTTGDWVNGEVNVYSEFDVNVPDIFDITYPKVINGQDYKGADVDFEISWKSRDADYAIIKLDGTDFSQKVAHTGTQKFNVKNILELKRITFNEYTSDKQTFTFTLTPFKQSAQVINGKDEKITILFDKGDNVIPRALAMTRIAEQFVSKFDLSVFADETSKYLTHVAHFGEGNNKPVTTWVGDRGTLILKLYEPLSTELQVGSQLAISKVQSQTMIETISISTEDVPYCKPLKGPNFNVDNNDGFGFKVFNDLIQAGASTSNSLITKYLTKNGVDTSELGIEYIAEGTYKFSNFVHFGSAEERVNNFMYKVQLLEQYKAKYSLLTETSHIPDGNADILTEDSDPMNLIWNILTTELDFTNQTYDINYEIAKYNSINEDSQIKNILDSMIEIVRNFDGFERFLYFDTANLSLSYPKYLYAYPNGVAAYLPEASEDVGVWYDNIINIAIDYDTNNINYLVKHIPEFITYDAENQDFIVFLDMIGQHFDNIWVYINKLKNNKYVTEQFTIGINDDMIYHLLKSFGWDGRRAYNSNYLWEYLYGTDKDGNVKYGIPLRDANNQVWRRILNNLPYLLKHKGTSRSLKAILSCYGIPSSLLTIMEFSSIDAPDATNNREFTYDDYTAALKLLPDSYVNVEWKQIPGTQIAPESIELRFLPTTTGNFRLLHSNNFYLDFSASNSQYSQMNFCLNDNESYTSSQFPLSTENYSNILIRKGVTNELETQYDIILQTTDGIRVTNTSSISFTSFSDSWSNECTLTIGGDFNGNIDEFRLWRGQLDTEKYEIHTLQPDSIVGNSYTASTSDLVLRLDFEYPKNLVITPTIKNVAISNIYDYSYADAINMYSATSYPYQYVPYERIVTATVPSLGNTVSNKIRFEDIELISDLNHTTRSTKKAFDRAGVDSNRLGIFLSPVKELNMDIVKTFGKFNIDNYIGSPEDEYGDSYKDLDVIRNYYFQRLDRNIHEYIQLVKYIDKSLFDVLADLTPARAKVSKGLLIEPHYLERSKTRIIKPVGEYDNYDGNITVTDTVELESYNNGIDIGINMNDSYQLEVENSLLETLIENEKQYDISTNYILNEAEISGILEDSKIETAYPTYPELDSYVIDCNLGSNISGEIGSTVTTIVGLDSFSLANAGFGLYGIPFTTGSAKIYENNDIVGVSRSGSWKRAFVLKESYTVKSPLRNKDTESVDYGLYGYETKTNYRYRVTFTTMSAYPKTGSNIESVTPVNGYLPTHYKFVNGLSEGDRRSFFKGSLQTSLTTPDGKSPVEIVYTNPNKLKISPTGRGAGEPILIVE
jgi:hypothetical protein